MLLDIAKESSDAFPPLKSCLGGINALIKHYEVRWNKVFLIPLTIATQEYNDVKDKLSGLIPWLDKLLDTLAKVNPNDDREEVERRSQLAKFAPYLEYLVHPTLTLHDRSLEDIETRAQALLAKGKVTRALDKKQDLGEVITLVEKLRQAILIYQVSVRGDSTWRLLTPGTDVTATVDIQPSRPFDREFLPLVFDSEIEPTVGCVKSSFDVLLKLHQVRKRGPDQGHQITPLQKSPINRKIESVRARLERLKVEENPARDISEFKRQKCLYECAIPSAATIAPVDSITELSRVSRTGCKTYPNIPLLVRTRRTKAI